MMKIYDNHITHYYFFRKVITFFENQVKSFWRTVSESKTESLTLW